VADILLIEDDAGFRRTVARALAAAGHHVRQAPDGVDGVRLFLTHRPALVITDIVMPEKEGLEVIRELRRHSTEIPIIAISGIADRAGFYLRAATLFGADATLAKPFRFAQLLHTVDDLLSRFPTEAGSPSKQADTGGV
jgi:DNA-binding response OmpR family regulator